MAVRVQKIDVNGHRDGSQEYAEGTSITVDAGVLFVRSRGASASSSSSKVIAVYRPGAWESADVTEG